MRGRETSRCEHNEFYVLMVAVGIGEAEPIRPWKHRRTAGVSPDPIIELWPWSQARHLPLSDASLLALDLWKDKFRIGLDLMLGVFHEMFALHHAYAWLMHAAADFFFSFPRRAEPLASLLSSWRNIKKDVINVPPHQTRVRTPSTSLSRIFPSAASTAARGVQELRSLTRGPDFGRRAFMSRLLL